MYKDYKLNFQGNITKHNKNSNDKKLYLNSLSRNG